MTASCCFSGTRITLPTEAISDSASARCASSQWEPAEIADMPSSTSAGVLGMTRTTATPSGHPGLDEGGGDAGRERHQQLTGPERAGDLVEHLRHVLRLHDQRDGVGLGGGLDVGDHRDAVPLHELGGARRALLADEELVDPAAGPDQAGQQGLAHDSGADDGGLLHVSAR